MHMVMTYLLTVLRQWFNTEKTHRQALETNLSFTLMHQRHDNYKIGNL